MRLYGDFGIDQVKDQGILEPEFQKSLQDLSRISRRPSPSVVTVVGQHDRKVAEGVPRIESFPHGHGSRKPGLAILPDPLAELVGSRLSQFLVTVGHNDH